MASWAVAKRFIANFAVLWLSFHCSLGQLSDPMGVGVARPPIPTPPTVSNLAYTTSAAPTAASAAGNPYAYIGTLRTTARPPPSAKPSLEPAASGATNYGGVKYREVPPLPTAATPKYPTAVQTPAPASQPNEVRAGDKEGGYHQPNSEYKQPTNVQDHPKYPEAYSQEYHHGYGKDGHIHVLGSSSEEHTLHLVSDHSSEAYVPASPILHLSSEELHPVAHVDSHPAIVVPHAEDIHHLSHEVIHPLVSPYHPLEEIHHLSHEVLHPLVSPHVSLEELHPVAHVDTHPAIAVPHHSSEEIHHLSHEVLHPLISPHVPLEELHPVAHVDTHPAITVPHYSSEEIHHLSHEVLHPLGSPYHSSEEIHHLSNDVLHPLVSPHTSLEELHPVAHVDTHPAIAIPHHSSEEIHHLSHEVLHPLAHDSLSHDVLHPLISPHHSYEDIHHLSHEVLHPLVSPHHSFEDIHHLSHEVLHPLVSPHHSSEIHHLSHEVLHPLVTPHHSSEIHHSSHDVLHPLVSPHHSPGEIHHLSHEVLHPLVSPHLASEYLHPVAHVDEHHSLEDFHHVDLHPLVSPHISPELHAVAHVDPHPAIVVPDYEVLHPLVSPYVPSVGLHTAGQMLPNPLVNPHTSPTETLSASHVAPQNSVADSHAPTSQTLNGMQYGSPHSEVAQQIQSESLHPLSHEVQNPSHPPAQGHSSVQALNQHQDEHSNREHHRQTSKAKINSHHQLSGESNEGSISHKNSIHTKQGSVPIDSHERPTQHHDPQDSTERLEEASDEQGYLDYKLQAHHHHNEEDEAYSTEEEKKRKIQTLKKVANQMEEQLEHHSHETNSRSASSEAVRLSSREGHPSIIKIKKPPKLTQSMSKEFRKMLLHRLLSGGKNEVHTQKLEKLDSLDSAEVHHSDDFVDLDREGKLHRGLLEHFSKIAEDHVSSESSSEEAMKKTAKEIVDLTSMANTDNKGLEVDNTQTQMEIVQLLRQRGQKIDENGQVVDVVGAAPGAHHQTAHDEGRSSHLFAGDDAAVTVATILAHARDASGAGPHDQHADHAGLSKLYDGAVLEVGGKKNDDPLEKPSIVSTSEGQSITSAKGY